MSREAPPLPAAEFARKIAAAAPRFGLDPAPDARDRLARYLAILDAARRRTNLTGRLSADDLVAHALESACGARRIPPSARVADVGSGAGFPGLPLAIVRPDAAVTAVEPRRLRADFLAQAAATVPVPNAAAFRGKPAGLPARSAEVAASRAVGGIAGILRREGAFLEPGGVYLAWTTDAAALAGELAPGFVLEAVDPVPGSDRKVIALFRKKA
jgi:16S rRNA (guanine527-N7)-methyltransferase